MSAQEQQSAAKPVRTAEDGVPRSRRGRMAIVIGGALCSLAIGGAFLAHYLISNESQRAKYSSFDFAGNLRRLNALTRLQGLADIVCAAVLLAGLICLVAGIVVYVRSRLRPAPRVQGPSDAAQEMVLCRCPHHGRGPGRHLPGMRGGVHRGRFRRAA